MYILVIKVLVNMGENLLHFSAQQAMFGCGQGMYPKTTFKLLRYMDETFNST